MAIDGVYEVEGDTPMGKLEEKWTFKTKGKVLAARLEGPMGTVEVTGKVNGNQFSWDSDVESPMGKMRLSCNGKVTGSDISGDIKAGEFGTSPFKGKKV